MMSIVNFLSFIKFCKQQYCFIFLCIQKLWAEIFNISINWDYFLSCDGYGTAFSQQNCLQFCTSLYAYKGINITELMFDVRQTSEQEINLSHSKWARAWQNQKNDVCAQQGLRSAWKSTLTDQSSLGALWVAKDPNFLHVDSEDSDQTGWMSRLTSVFAGCISHFVGFVMLRLKIIS